MLPLGAQIFPATSDELLTSLTTGLAGVFQLPPRPIVLASGAAYPILDTLHVDLSGARIRDEFRPAPPAGPRVGDRPLTGSVGPARTRFDRARTDWMEPPANASGRP